jgi:DNA-binding NarL/FixJ family response regulator
VKSGAAGYLLKSYDPDTVLRLTRSAAAGEPALTPQLAARILEEFARMARRGPGSGPGLDPAIRPTSVAAPAPGAAPLPDHVEPLSAREQDVLERLVAGRSNKEIAADLVVSENTVKFHLKNILQKLHLHSRAQVVAFALRHGLTEIPSGEEAAGSRPFG